MRIATISALVCLGFGAVFYGACGSSSSSGGNTGGTQTVTGGGGGAGGAVGGAGGSGGMATGGGGSGGSSAGSCKGVCGSADEQPGGCYCDPACKNQSPPDCCADYDTECKTTQVQLPAGCASGITIECNPVTNEGCNGGAGQACDLGTSSGQSVIACFDPPNDKNLGESCTNSKGPYCKGTMHCSGDVDGGTGTCKKFCCSNADCGGGTCAAFNSQLGTLGVCEGGTTDAGTDGGGGTGGGGNDAAADTSTD